MADITTTKIWVDGEQGVTAAKMNQIISGASIQPAFYTSKPTAGSADPADIALILKSGAYAQVPISTLAGSTTQAQIWSTRLRSFNSVGNPNFEVAQRNVRANLTNPVSGTFIEDRWALAKAGTAAYNLAGQIAAGIVLPGTSFAITSAFLRVQLTTQQLSLGVSDFIFLSQQIEGPLLRELINDVHSVSLLVRSSVANLNFSLALLDNGGTRSLVKLCSIPTANTWTLITLPNLPVWASGGAWNTTPGNLGYSLRIVLACGSSLMSPAADTWQTGGFDGAPGMSNFAASPVNSTFDIAFVQHEPGGLCSTLMDKSFTQNYDECLRYYQKSYDYAVIAGTVSGVGQAVMTTGAAAAVCVGPVRFHKPFAKIPTVAVYNPSTGAIGSIRDNASTDHASAAISATGLGTTGCSAISFATATAGAGYVVFQYTADAGW